MALARLPSDTFFREAFREADDVRVVPRRRDTTTGSRTIPATTRSLAPLSPSQFFSNFLPTPGGVMVPLAGPPVSGEARAVNRIIPVDVTVRLATTPRAIRTRTPPKFPERSRGVPAFWFVFLGFGKSMTRLHGRRRRRRRPTTRINSRRTSPG